MPRVTAAVALPVIWAVQVWRSRGRREHTVLTALLREAEKDRSQLPEQAQAIPQRQERSIAT